MIFKLISTILIPNAVYRLALNALVDKVCGLLVPALWNAVLFDLNLATQDLITDVLSGFAFVGTLTHHALVGNDSHGKVIGGQSMILSTHDFRGHVAWSATGFAGVVGGENASDTKICKSQVALVVKDKVLGLNITMDYQLGMH